MSLTGYMIERVMRGLNTANPGPSNAEIDAHVERIMAMQLAEGELPYPLLRRVPQPETSFATRPVPQHARRPTGDTAAAASFPEVPEGTEDSTTEIPTRPQEVPPGRSIHEPTEQRIRGTFKHYRRHQDMFEASLRAIIVPGNRRAEFQSLLGDWGTEISPYNYERAARIAHREKGWKPQQELLGLLGQVIRAREKVQKWHLRLPADDWRRPHAAGHHNLIEILKRTYAILNHGRAYERQVGGRRTRPAVQAAPRQLPLPAAQQQLPLPFFSATPTTQPLPEGVCQTIGDANAAVSPEEAAAILPQHAGHETDASSSDSEGTNGTVDPVADSLTHELDVPLDERTIQCTARYYRHQRRFQEMLFLTSVVDSDKLEFLSLFATGPHKANCKESTPMTIPNAEGFERAAEIISHNPGFPAERQAAAPVEDDDSESRAGAEMVCALRSKGQAQWKTKSPPGVHRSSKEGISDPQWWHGLLAREKPP